MILIENYGLSSFSLIYSCVMYYLWAGQEKMSGGG